MAIEKCLSGYFQCLVDTKIINCIRSSIVNAFTIIMTIVKRMIMISGH